LSLAARLRGTLVRAAATAIVASGAFGAAAAVETGSAQADEDGYLKVTVTGPSGSTTTNVATDEISGSNVDIARETIDGYPHTGMSVARLAQYIVGVDPASIKTVAVTTSAFGPGTKTLSGAEVRNGIPDKTPGDTNPSYALFSSAIAAVSFLYPGGGDDGMVSPVDGYLGVDITVLSPRLTVGMPQVSNGSPTVGAPVRFQAPSVSVNGTSVDPSNLAYSWNFGDGGGATTSSPTYSYSTAGTWDASAVVTDTATGAEGASPAVVLQVGSPPPGNGQHGGGGGGSGSSGQGGGNGSPQGPSSGVHRGESGAPSSSPTPTRSRKSTSKHKHANKHHLRSLSTHRSRPTPSASGSGVSGSAGGSGTGGGSGAVSAGSGGAANSPAGGSKAGTTGAGGARGGGTRAPSITSSVIPPGEVGVLVESNGGTVSLGGPVSPFLSVVRAAARATAAAPSKATDWQWLLGVLAVIVWLSVGTIRELGPRSRRRRLAA